jgi:hypothetical protein
VNSASHGSGTLSSLPKRSTATCLVRTAGVVLAMLLTLGVLQPTSLGAQVVAPDWQIDAAAWELSSQVTARVVANEMDISGTGHRLAAFVGDELRGVATPVQLGQNTWLFFLSIFAHVNAETVTFKVYLADRGVVADVRDSLLFRANAIDGTPAAPIELNAFVDFDFPPEVHDIADQVIEVGDDFAPILLGNHLRGDDDPVSWEVLHLDGSQPALSMEVSGGTILLTTPVLNWTASDTLVFTAVEQTQAQLAASDTAVFTVLPIDTAPDLATIPTQTAGLGGRFAPLDLAAHLTENDGDDIAWSSRFIVAATGDPVPDWTVGAAEFQSSMLVTATVASRGLPATGSGDLLAAIAHDTQGNVQIRGLATPVETLAGTIYFMTVYGDEVQQIRFRFYDSTLGELLPVYETIDFGANASQGRPDDPVTLQAGLLVVDIDAAGVATVSAVDTAWGGTERLEFTATDVASLHGFASSTQVNFTVFADHAPRVLDIPDQSVESGTIFETFDLDDYLVEADGDLVTWSVASTAALIVDIDADGLVNVSTPTPFWTGTETLSFVAIDQTSNALSGSDAATFTVSPVDLAPELAPIPGQTIANGRAPTPISLTSFLTTLDDDIIGWGYDIPVDTPASTPALPDFDASSFDLNMNITAAITSQGRPVDTGNHHLVAYAADGEIRGVSTPVLVLDGTLFFLAIYGRSHGETIHLRFYDDSSGRDLAVAETVQIGDPLGTPTEPVELTAGVFDIDIDNTGTATLRVIDASFAGVETVRFIATDQTPRAHADSVSVSFTILADHAPVLADVADQTVEAGSPFTDVDLASLVTELDGDDVTYFVEGAVDYDVSVNGSLVQVSPPTPTWTGSETLTFVVRDLTTNALASTDTAVFTVRPLDRPPRVTAIPEQTVRQPFAFGPLDLGDYLSEDDGDAVTWSVTPVLPTPTGDPGWTVRPEDFQFSMDVVAILHLQGATPAAGNHTLAAFSPDDGQPDGLGAVRGLANPVHVGGQTLYFLTIFGNTSGQVRLRFYDADSGVIHAIHKPLLFSASESLGSVATPAELDAGFLAYALSEDILHVDVLDPYGAGSGTVRVTAHDVGTVRSLSADTLLTFTVLEALPDSDGRLIPGTSRESVPIPSSATTAATAASLLDFSLVDGGGNDGLSLAVSAMVLHTSGEGPFAQFGWRLASPIGPDVIGVYDGGNNTVTFSDLAITVADGSAQSFDVRAFYADNTLLTEGQTVQLSIDGDVDLAVTGTAMTGSNPVIDNGTGAIVGVTATQLVLVTPPAPLDVVSGAEIDFDTDPVLAAYDAVGNLDLDFNDTVTITTSGAGVAIVGNGSVAAIAGIASFQGLSLTYDASTDGEVFALRARDTGAGAEGSLQAVSTPPLRADVVASRLRFSQQPPEAATASEAFDGAVTVAGVDAAGLLDTAFAATVTLSAVLFNDPITSGSGALASTEGLSKDASHGLATWNNLSYNTNESISLHATTPSFPVGSDFEAYSTRVAVGASEHVYTPGPLWSMISLSLDVLDPGIATLFPDAISLYGFTDSYTLEQRLERGAGYWLSLPATPVGTYPVAGPTFTTTTVDVPAGWSMIGPVDTPVYVASLRANHPEVISVYGFSQGYEVAQIMHPGLGYWINTDAAVLLDLAGTPASRRLIEPPVAFAGAILWAESYGVRQQIRLGTAEPVALPPLPPPGILDLRVDIDGVDSWQVPEMPGSEYSVHLQGEDPVLGWDIPETDSEDWTLVVDGMATALVGRSAWTGTVDGVLIQLRHTPSRLQSSSLGYNFPNPFNPTTTIAFRLQIDSPVTLTVFDIAGRRVRTLVHGRLTAGDHDVTWDGRDDAGDSVGSGVYLTELRTPDRRSVRKMVLTR